MGDLDVTADAPMSDDEFAAEMRRSQAFFAGELPQLVALRDKILTGSRDGDGVEALRGVEQMITNSGSHIKTLGELVKNPRWMSKDRH